LSDATYRVINSGPSPYGRKVCIALIEKGLAFETVQDLPWGEATETRRHSPLEQLPILIPPEGDPVFDSAMILDWLELIHPRPALVPSGVDARVDCMRRRALGERLMEIAQALVFERYRDQPAQATIDRLSRKITGGLAALEQLHADPADGAIECDQGHIAAATTLLCWEYITKEGIAPLIDELQWRGRYPALGAFVERMESRPAFEQTTPRPMAIDIRSEVVG
jgi:glutathione S-transferase